MSRLTQMIAITAEALTFAFIGAMMLIKEPGLIGYTGYLMSLITAIGVGYVIYLNTEKEIKK